MSKAGSTVLLVAAPAIVGPSDALSDQYLDVYVPTDDRAVSSSENIHDLPRSEDENLKSEMLAELIRWIGDHADYDVTLALRDPPDVRFCSAGEIIRYEGKDAVVDPELYGVYDRIERAIFLVRPWNAANTEHLGRLLHELVHDLQFQNVEWPCKQKPEWEAYRLQAKWLAEHEVEKEFDWRMIYSSSQCPEDPFDELEYIWLE